MYEIASPAFAPRTGAARLTFINDVYQGTRCYSFPHPRYAVLLVSTPGIPLVFAHHAAGRTAELRLQTDTRQRPSPIRTRPPQANLAIYPIGTQNLRRAPSKPPVC